MVRSREVSAGLIKRGVRDFSVRPNPRTCDIIVSAASLPNDVLDWLRSLNPPISVSLGGETKPL